MGAQKSFNKRKNFVELGKLRHKLCVEPNDFEKYLKNYFSKETLQFVADYNVEAGIRQIGKFGLVLSLADPNQENVWKNQIRYKFHFFCFKK